MGEIRADEFGCHLALSFCFHETNECGRSQRARRSHVDVADGRLSSGQAFTDRSSQTRKLRAESHFKKLTWYLTFPTRSHTPLRVGWAPVTYRKLQLASPRRW